MFNTDIKSLKDLHKRFPDEKSCIEYLEFILWNGDPVSPFDPESKVYKFKNGKYMCGNTKKYFNIKTGTMYENTKLSLITWFEAMWYITSFKKGISSIQLASELCITQKTAWFLLQRIRVNMGIENYNKLEGIVEADETFVGGKNKNRHTNKKVRFVQAKEGRNHYKDKTIVYGMIQRGGKITAIVVPDTSGESLFKNALKYVAKGSAFITDDHKSYKGLDKFYAKFTVKENQHQFINQNETFIHTNHIEGAWKSLKCIVSGTGTYNHVSPKHMQKYVDEFVYRFNMRKFEQSDRFNWIMLNSRIRTRLKDLANG